MLEKIIYEMLTEDTGENFLDSGGAYGRHHQRNAKKTLQDFKNEPLEHYTFNGDEIERSVSVFQYLMHFGLSVTPLCEYFNKRNKQFTNWDADADVYGVSAEAWEWLTDNYDVQVIRTFNTYNEDSDLTQTLQGSFITINGNSYLILQIHGGCDVRGGYTDARLFKHDDLDFVAEYKSQEEILHDIEHGLITRIEGKDAMLILNKLRHGA
jgi:hypothetical protein